jgi:hypothetical protein
LKDIIYKDPTTVWFLMCNDCGAQSGWKYNESDTIAAWNRRADDAPKWSTEVPTEEGLYWLSGYYTIPTVVNIYKKELNPHFWRKKEALFVEFLGIDSDAMVELDTICSDGYTSWQKINVPALPEEGGKDE